MSSFQHSKWLDNKRCTVEVGWGIFNENTTIYFFVPNSGRKYFIKNSPWLLFRKMIISQLELGLPVHRDAFYKEVWNFGKESILLIPNGILSVKKRDSS